MSTAVLIAGMCFANISIAAFFNARNNAPEKDISLTPGELKAMEDFKKNRRQRKHAQLNIN